MLASLTFALIAYSTPFDVVLDAPELSGALVSAVVAKADGTILYERNSGQRVMPASNQKLLTTMFAMNRLGPNFVPKTRFWKESDRVIVDAPGDPTMTSAQLLSAAKKLGIDKIMPIFVRQAYRPQFGPNWEYGDLPEYYAAAVTAFTIDKGVFKVWASDGQVEPLPDFVDVWLRVLPGITASAEYDPFQKIVTVRGPLPAERKELMTCAFNQPDRAAARALGGPLFVSHSLPSRAPDFTLDGKPLKEIIAECLTISDNLYAENLLLMATQQGKPAEDNPYPAAQQGLKKFLVETVGWEANDVRPDDGSGMSRHNNLTVRGVVKLLVWAQKQPWFEDWRAGLAVPGKGTLRSRLAGSSIQGKTGTLDMASAISGYVTRKSGERVIVSVIFNHYACSSAKAREIADRFVKLAEETPISGTNYASIL
ncbi:MAG: D-alanyl-D-alanine carboxypeptidase [Fimbriimonadaceae bacterium]|nr:D-alanyl-D-alanine carboxypeptidase [Fimbriimonadaceae bacterium]